jgi:hypothetical protein
MASLQDEISRIGREWLWAAVELGRQQAKVDRKVWGLPTAGDQAPALVSSLLAVWVAVVERQAREARAATLLGDGKFLLLGDKSRVGLIRPDTVIRAGTRWLTAATSNTYVTNMLGYRATLFQWGKQAIPAIDIKTTTCCLKVAGQVVKIDDKFKLEGTPRFADKVDWPPFHWYCRTVTALVPIHLAEDELTAEIRDAAAGMIAKKARLRR